MVTRRKKAISFLREGQGREPRRPMPIEGVEAKIKVKGGRGILVVDVIVDEWMEKGGPFVTWFLCLR